MKALPAEDLNWTRKQILMGAMCAVTDAAANSHQFKIDSLALRRLRYIIYRTAADGQRLPVFGAREASFVTSATATSFSSNIYCYQHNSHELREGPRRWIMTKKMSELALFLQPLCRCRSLRISRKQNHPGSNEHLAIDWYTTRESEETISQRQT